MKYRTSHLDPRILGGLRTVLMPNDVLTEEQVSRFPLRLEGTVGYAAECLMDFQELRADPRVRLFRIVKVNCGSPFPFRCCVMGNPTAEGDFSFFLPANQVAAYADGAEAEKPKEKKIKPYTLKEFLKKFPIHTTITLRKKGDNDCIVTSTVIGYRTRIICNEVCLGVEWVSLGTLAEEYEYQYMYSEIWKPFGVEGV